MKLSKAQARVMEHLNNTIAVLNKYETYEEFFNNSVNEQNTFTTALHCNGAYDSSEKYSAKDPEGWAEMKADFYRARDEHTLLVFAKTETINKLEKLGLLEVVQKAEFNGGAEIVKVM